ncbi:MAG: FkbM family methyltransferase [Sulfolobales archaeon]
MGCKKLLWGAWLTVKTLGPVVLIREVIRRLTGVGYTYRGIPVRTGADFWVLRYVKRRYDIRREGDQIVVSTEYGQIAVGLNDVSTLYAVGDPMEDMYAADVKGGVVLDVGAGIGDSTLFFVSRGARRVYAFEPVEKHFRYLVDNVARNNAVDRVVAFNYGLWVEDGVLKVKYQILATGLTVGDEVELKVRRLGDVLRDVADREGGIDLVKMDCEGCEYALLTTPCEVVRLARQYIVEIHGTPTPLIHHMSKCGYGTELVHRNHDFFSNVYRFTHRG